MINYEIMQIIEAHRNKEPRLPTTLDRESTRLPEIRTYENTIKRAQAVQSPVAKLLLEPNVNRYRYFGINE